MKRWKVWFIVCYQVWRLIIDFTFHNLVTGPVHSCAFSTPREAYSPAAISAHWSYNTLCHLCSTRYLSKMNHVMAKCLAQGHNIETMPQYWEGRNMVFFWKSCTKRAATSTKRHALTIASRPSVMYQPFFSETSLVKAFSTIFIFESSAWCVLVATLVPWLFLINWSYQW